MDCSTGVSRCCRTRRTDAAPTHKDLTPRNMLWAPGASAARPRVRIVAWDDVAPGCRAEDLSRFLLGSGVLHYQGYQAQSARVAGRADALAPPLVAFAEAYLAATGGEGDAPGLEQFAWELQRLVPFGLLYSPQWNHPRARPSPALDLAARACERLRAASKPTSASMPRPPQTPRPTGSAPRRGSRGPA